MSGLWSKAVNSFTKRPFFRLVQIESICRRQFIWSSNDDLCLWLGRTHCGKRKKCWFPAFSPFPTMFSKTLFLSVVKSDCVVKGLSRSDIPTWKVTAIIRHFLKLYNNCIGWELNVFSLTHSHNDTFWHPWETSLLKTLWEKEKLLATSNFSFSPSVFCPFWELSAIFVNFKIVVCKLFQFERF